MRKKAKQQVSAALEAQGRVHWIKHKGVKILKLDFSGLSAEASLQVMEQFTSIMRQEGKASVRLLSDVTGTQYDTSVASQWRQVRFQYNDRITYSAIYGASGLVLTAVKTFYQMLKLMGLKSGSNFLLADSEAQAKDYLANSTKDEAAP